MVRIVVTMPEHESEILTSMADGDMRFPKEQIRFLIREEAIRQRDAAGQTAIHSI